MEGTNAVLPTGWPIDAMFGLWRQTMIGVALKNKLSIKYID